MPERGWRPVRRLGIMGGTFDPVHYGHLLIASEAVYRLDLEHVVLMPTGRPWQKDPAAVSPAEHRYRMTLLAAAEDPRFSVSRMEIDRPGPTYTVDTLREIRAVCGNATELFFIAGADTLATISTWHEGDAVPRLAHLVMGYRAGQRTTLAGAPPDRVTKIEVPGWGISSTLVRNRVRRRQSIRYLVADPVARYIQENGLYRAPASGAPR